MELVLNESFLCCRLLVFLAIALKFFFFLSLRFFNRLHSSFHFFSDTLSRVMNVVKTLI